MNAIKKDVFEVIEEIDEKYSRPMKKRDIITCTTKKNLSLSEKK